MSSKQFEVLMGLPAYGPPAIPLPAGFSGVSEGYVVKFLPFAPDEWVGNFRYGSTKYSATHLHPDGKRVLVIAGGSDYLVNPHSRTVDAQTADNIHFSKELKDLEMIVFGNNIQFWAEGKAGPTWSTARLSWDGIEVTKVTQDFLVGKCYSALDELWHEFNLNLATGEVTGAIYEADRRKIFPVAVKRQ